MGLGDRHRPARAVAVAACALLLMAQAPAPPDTKPYDDRLVRLSEILGAIHYLRELCGADEGQAWRDRMRELIDAEGSTAARRTRFTRSFNQGYHSYSRTYKACTSTAQTAISRFLGEGAQIADALVRSIP